MGRRRPRFGRTHRQADPRRLRESPRVQGAQDGQEPTDDPLDPRTIASLKVHRKAQAAEKLAAGPAYADQALVFADEIGDPLAPEAVSAAFKRHVREAALPRLTIHGLRHTYATIALDAGVDVLYVAELLGHSSPAITREIYQHVRRDRLSGAAQRVADAIFGG